MAYKFIDGKERHDMYPKTFSVPSDDELDKLKVGDTVLIGFDVVEDSESDGESLKCTVTEIRGESIKAVLKDSSSYYDDLKAGISVSFDKKNILDIQPAQDMLFPHQAEAMEGLLETMTWGESINSVFDILLRKKQAWCFSDDFSLTEIWIMLGKNPNLNVCKNMNLSVEDYFDKLKESFIMKFFNKIFSMSCGLVVPEIRFLFDLVNKLHKKGEVSSYILQTIDDYIYKVRRGDIRF